MSKLADGLKEHDPEYKASTSEKADALEVKICLLCFSLVDCLVSDLEQIYLETLQGLKFMNMYCDSCDI